MKESGLAVTDRDPAALIDRGIGMTDFSKLVSVRADELSAEELREGWARLGRVLGWLRPRTVAILGITTYRTATGLKKAQLGWQPEIPEAQVAGLPTYVMPNPSGLNAHTNVADMAEHLRRAVSGRTPRKMTTPSGRGERVDDPR
jgi:TDG/mug DNA glycosylase family protein